MIDCEYAEVESWLDSVDADVDAEARRITGTMADVEAAVRAREAATGR